MDVEIACPCPPKADGTARHQQDTVTLRDTLDFRSAVAIRNEVRLLKEEDSTTGEILAALTESYLLFGISAWTLVDEKNKPVPVSKTAIRERLLVNWEIGEQVGDAADELYMKKVVLPLLVAASTSSPPTPTTASTSAPRVSSKRHQRPSSPSSISTIPTASTATTSSGPGGVSSFSGSSESAA